jgi:hypothetical protein
LGPTLGPIVFDWEFRNRRASGSAKNKVAGKKSETLQICDGWPSDFPRCEIKGDIN